MFKWAGHKVKATSEVEQAISELNNAYTYFDHAEGPANIQSAIYNIKAAELRLDAELARAKERRE